MTTISHPRRQSERQTDINTGCKPTDEQHSDIYAQTFIGTYTHTRKQYAYNFIQHAIGTTVQDLDFRIENKNNMPMML